MRRIVILMALSGGLLGCSRESTDADGSNESPSAEAAAPSAQPSRTEPQPVESATDMQSANLLQQYVGRDPVDPAEPRTWALPFQSKRAVVALLITAARGRVDDLPLVLSRDAMWGLPDTRELGARPVFGKDDGAAFLAAFRRAAARFPAGARWEMQPLMPGVQESVRTGAEPMWSYFASGPDRLVFRQVVRNGRAVIDYVGFFEELPSQAVIVRGQGAPPPITPPLRLPDGRIITSMPRQAPSSPPPADAAAAEREAAARERAVRERAAQSRQ